MKETLKELNSALDKLNIKKGDKIVVVADFLKILLLDRENNHKITSDDIINCLINKIGKKGTLVFNTFSWDFITKGNYDYKKTLSLGGTISNQSLKRKEFTRTYHPIYSFSVFGNQKKKLLNIKSMDSFGKESAFYHMIMNDFKYLGIGVDLNSGFAFVHVAEQEAKVEYRFIKKFSGNYTDSKEKSSIVDCTMFVRDKNLSTGTRFDGFYEHLIKKNYLIDTKIKNLSLYSFNLLDIHKLMVIDLKNDREYIKK